MSTDLRLRVAVSKSASGGNVGATTGADEDSSKAKVPQFASSLATPLHWILFVIYIVIVYLWVLKLDASLPWPLSSDAAGAKRFSEERARRHLQALVSFGPRPVGSHGAEVLARNYILNEIEKIRSAEAEAAAVAASNRLRFEVDIQKPSGCFILSSDFFNCYKNVTNIVVRLGRRRSVDEEKAAAHHSLLINCHFDSVPASPGASDDGASCALMLELVNVFAHRHLMNPDEESLPHDLIFLFNGAEETYLQASHGFITQHPWRHSIRAFINLEAAGAGGREMLFQVGPGNAWLSHAYINNAPYPHCNIMAQELFQHDLIPSDTDFRIFRDFGHSSGMDFAYISNGYVYHTEFDNYSFIQPGSIQRAGDNVQATISAVLRSPCFTKPCPEQDRKLVFFDVLGLFVVAYPVSYGTLLNYATCLLIIARILRHCRRQETAGGGGGECYSISTILFASLVHLVAIFTTIGTTWIMIKFVHIADLSMCWYSKPYLVVPIYLCPTLIVGFATHALISWKYFQSSSSSAGKKLHARRFRLEKASFHAALLLISAILFLLTWLGIASAYYALLHVLLPQMRDVIGWLYQKVRGGTISETATFIFHAIALSPIVAFGSYGVFSVLQFFIPIMGRSGTVENSEVVIGAICVACSIAILLYMGGLVHITVSFSELLKFMVFGTALMIAVCSLTTFGAPYQYDPEAPRLRRLRLQHVSRKIYNVNGGQNSNENALFITGMDFRGVGDLPAATFLQGAHVPPCLPEDQAFCGLPYYGPFEDRCPPRNNLWISVPNAPHLETPVSIKRAERTVNSDRTLTMNFSVTAHDFAGIFVTPLNNWTLDRWSLTNDLLWPERTYFVRLNYVGRSKDIGPWLFSLTLAPPDDSPLPTTSDDTPKLLLGVASHYVHGPNKYSEATLSLVNSIRERRQKPPTATFGYWKWMMTPDAFNSEYVAQYFT